LNYLVPDDAISRRKGEFVEKSFWTFINNVFGNFTTGSLRFIGARNGMIVENTVLIWNSSIGEIDLSNNTRD
jgi:hypothetical protein